MASNETKIARAEASLGLFTKNHFDNFTQAREWFQNSVLPSSWFENLHAWQTAAYFLRDDSRNNAYTNCLPTGIANMTYPSPLFKRKLIICHELAHIMGWNGYHGAVFASNYLAAVNKWMGSNARKKLRDAFVEHNVNF